MRLTSQNLATNKLIQELCIWLISAQTGRPAALPTYLLLLCYLLQTHGQAILNNIGGSKQSEGKMLLRFEDMTS